MGKSNGIVLLLACILFSTAIGGVAHAAGCTPTPETQMCITTDKTTYNPGEAVIATVEEILPPNTSEVTASVEIFPVPPPCNYVYLSCAIAWATITLHPGPAGVWSGAVTIRLPDNVTVGHYEVVVFSTLPSVWTPVVGAAITIATRS